MKYDKNGLEFFCKLYSFHNFPRNVLTSQKFDIWSTCGCSSFHFLKATCNPWPSLIESNHEVETGTRDTPWQVMDVHWCVINFVMWEGNHVCKTKPTYGWLSQISPIWQSNICSDFRSCRLNHLISTQALSQTSLDIMGKMNEKTKEMPRNFSFELSVERIWA